jgi:hypothetical protein
MQSLFGCVDEKAHETGAGASYEGEFGFEVLFWILESIIEVLLPW